MAQQYVVLPLFEDPDYKYSVALEGEAFTFRAYYNERTLLWHYDLSLEDGAPVILGSALVPSYPIGSEYILTPLTGYFSLVPIGTTNTEKYKEFPFELAQYYNLYYIYDDGGE